MQLQSGTLLQGGKYRIEKVLGQGGFGITYQAVQVALNRKVAIKEFFMKEYCNRDSETSHVSVPSEGSKELVGKFRQKFIKEAQNIAALNHPHIIRIHDVFEENGTAYYVMEFWDNGSLADLVKRQGALDEAEALRYIRQVADALGYIHERKMNHLDVKPGNILLDENRNAVLIDFGLSKRYDEEGNQTSTTPVGISHGYAPLEQYKKGGVGTFSPATDIYSLGATLYKLITGNTPPEANDVMDDGLPALPSSVSSATASAIEKAMQPTRRNRPQSVKELLGMLDAEPVEEEESEDTELVVVDKPTPQPEPVPTPAFQPALQPKVELKVIPVTEQEESSSKKWVGAVIVGLLVVLAVVFWPKGGEEKYEPLALQVENRQRLQTVQAAPTVADSVEQIVKKEIKKEEVPAPSLLYVTTSPSGATVYVDDKKVGTTPIEGKEVSQGRHTVKITKSGYEGVSEKKQFGKNPVVLNETLVAEVKETKPVQTVASQPVESSTTVAEVKEEVKDTVPVQMLVQQPVKSSAPTIGTINGHQYVDLGLSVKWADRNVGADSPSERGGHFAWGEIQTKSRYRKSNSVTHEKNFGDIAGNPQYDAARANWGGSWRLPTSTECKELLTKCKWHRIKIRGSDSYNAYEVIGPNGNSIILPYTDYTDGKTVSDHPGVYWTSMPSGWDDEMNEALGMELLRKMIGNNLRYIGYCIRPVSE